MKEQELRRADFITSIILILFAIWVLIEAFGMPLEGSYAGVESVWYVSPALFPIIVGVALIVLGVVLLLNSIRTGGAQYFLQTISSSRVFKQKLEISDSIIRFISILIALFSFIYLYIPRVDFFITTVLFLSFFISIFLFEDMRLLKKLTWFYVGGSVVFIIIFASDIDKVINSYFRFFTDIFALIFLLAFIIYTYLTIKHYPELKISTLYTVVGVSFLVPLLICPIFRYFLLIPLPKEGLVIELMHSIYYALQ